MNSRVFKTKRFMYHTIKKWYENSLSNIISRSSYCYTMYGVRRIGKTTILKQLNQEIDNSVYYDCNTLSKGDFIEILDEDYNNGVRVFLIDEICKFPEIDCLIAYIKNNYVDSTYIVTGSTSALVKNIGHSIGRGPVVYLPPITYCEWLSWNNNCDYNKSFNYSNIESFNNYIKSDSLFPMNDNRSYVESVIQDTLKSYKARLKYISELKDIVDDFREDIFEDILCYMTIINLTMTTSNNKYLKISTGILEDRNVTNRDGVLIEKVLKNYRSKIMKYSTEDIDKYLHLLEVSGLVNSNNLIKINKDNIIELLESRYYIFRYPQYIMSLLDYPELRSDYYAGVIENLLLDTIATYYKYAGKYRNMDLEEIDVCYTSSADNYGIEIKCRNINNFIKDIPHYINLSEKLGFKDIAFTAKDLKDMTFKYHYNNRIYNVIRYDILMLVYELAYMENPKYHKSLNELLNQYNIISDDIDEYINVFENWKK